MALIEVKDLSFGYTKDMVLEKVNMTVEAGEYVGIIGANGAGKSTLMKLILGELTPVSGEIYMDGKCVWPNAAGSARFSDYQMLGYVPQVGFSRVSNFPANVEEVVLANLCAEIGLLHMPKKVHRERVDRVLDAVGMLEYKKRLLNDLSGGQQQRVMIARALVGEPKLLLLDEPFTCIDEEAEGQLYALLQTLNQKEKLAILMISHDTEQIARYTNRFYHIKHRTVHEDRSSVFCDEEWKDKRIIKNTSNYYATKKEREASKQNANGN